MPPNVRRLHGNRHTPAAEGVRAVVAEPAMPTWLDAEARAEWRRVVPELRRLRLLSMLDRVLLAAYCVGHSSWHAMVRAEDAQAARFYRANVLPLAKELALTPNARLRMPAPEDELDDLSDLD
jgi:phage terminase small subunit